MPKRLYPTDDFEANIRIFSGSEGGRPSPVFNGIRWDFAYMEDQPKGVLYMIWPDFTDRDGNSITDEAPLPVGKELSARMLILVDEARAFHRTKLSIGVRFYCHEGGKRVAEGVVTRITGLFEQR